MDHEFGNDLPPGKIVSRIIMWVSSIAAPICGPIPVAERAIMLDITVVIMFIQLRRSAAYATQSAAQIEFPPQVRSFLSGLPPRVSRGTRTDDSASRPRQSARARAQTIHKRRTSKHWQPLRSSRAEPRHASPLSTDVDRGVEATGFTVFEAGVSA